MFSGIIEAVGSIESIETLGSDKRIIINTGTLDLSDLRVGDSISVNGVCLSLIERQQANVIVDLSQETLSCTTCNELRIGDPVNLEQALKLNARLNGHIVSGHIDGTGIIHNRYSEARSERLEIKFPTELKPYICKKGSICVDGISLTINQVDATIFTVNIIPHTQLQTTITHYTQGKTVNLEIDIIARYLESMLQHHTDRL